MKKAFSVSLILLMGMLGVVACGQAPQQQPPAQNQATSSSAFPDLPLAPAMPPPPGDVVLEDDFGGELSGAWRVLDTAETPGEQAYWYTEAGFLVQGGTTMEWDSVDPAYLIVNPEPEWEDYTIRANIYVETNDEVGLIFRVTEEGFYRFRMRSAEFEGPYSVGVDRYQDERYTVLWHEPGNGFPFRRWFTVQIEVVGDTFTISVDGRLLAVVQDPVFPAGGAGLYAWSEGGAYFDDVVVTR
jgi:hypothetical protein